ncbi:glycosyltransferase family 1 protein [Spirosoma sp. 48-14]|uniref:glycosyltransferase family 4 protein n=1 Tax=Spirosoma sp. 48-14 TaxID=1895854 RepID=UPI00095D37C4|nr:glycosyltransferase family 1 protein [Spirosoma sp. 48-14]OJW78851.1 MAG: hypothetical protein BGO59_10270 [Spirosoma sp. 48-14]
MRIFFDHQAFTIQNFGGISRYYCELISGINALNFYDAHLSILWSNNENLSEYDFKVSKFPFLGKHRLYKYSNQAYNILDMLVNDFDLYHATYFDNSLKKFSKKKPLVTTFYDMTYEILSKDFKELANDKSIIEQKKVIANQAAHLIAISESTKKDMIELLNIQPEKISVVYLASTFELCEPEVNMKTEDGKDQYLLFVGKRDNYKNFVPLIKSISFILKKYRINLICAGGGAFTSAEHELINSLGLSDKVYYRDINDATLQTLYMGALAFIFPSLYEGFGIPILEAFSCNCPCILSNVSSLPEIAGTAALYFDPKEPDSMMNAVEKVIVDNSVKHDLIIQGRKRLTAFSWNNTVTNTLNVYKSIV